MYNGADQKKTLHERISQVKKKKDMEMKYDHLPSAIVEEILARLPVKSIIRFRCLSKEWSSSLISIKFHKRRSSLAPPQSRCQKIVEAMKCGLIIRHCDQGNFKVERILWFPLKSPFTRVTILGSCHGLVCVALDSDFVDRLILWNPSTGIYRQLPNRDDTPGCCISAYGFGYDSISQDYKIFLMFSDGLFSPAYTQIFSLKANSWKRIRNDELFMQERGLLLNGALHWYFCGEVIAFDLEKEEFYTVQMPESEDESENNPEDESEHDDNANKYFGIIGGQWLCMSWWIRGSSFSYQKIWIMKEYRVESSWVELIEVIHGKIRYKCEDFQQFIDNDGKLFIEFVHGTLNVVDFELNRLFVMDSGTAKYLTEDLTSPYLFTETEE